MADVTPQRGTSHPVWAADTTSINDWQEAHRGSAGGDWRQSQSQTASTCRDFVLEWIDKSQQILTVRMRPYKKPQPREQTKNSQGQGSILTDGLFPILDYNYMCDNKMFLLPHLWHFANTFDQFINDLLEDTQPEMSLLTFDVVEIRTESLFLLENRARCWGLNSTTPLTTWSVKTRILTVFVVGK